MTTTRKQLSIANTVRDEGYEVNGTISYNGKGSSINPIAHGNRDAQKYAHIWSNFDRNQCVARYVWEGLPNGIQSWNVERMLYYRGSLVGFKWNEQFYITPYTPFGLNIYGQPTKVQPLTFNGKTPGEDGEENGRSFWGETFELPINNAGDLAEYQAVLLYDNIPQGPQGNCEPRALLNRELIQEMAQVLARVEINIVISNKKILLQTRDANQADVVRRELENAFSSDSPFGVITSPLEAQTIQSTSDFQADDLFNTLKNLDAIRCFTSGIMASSMGGDKKERMVTGELDGNEEQVNLVSDIGLELREVFCRQVNEAFGLNIKVSKRADKYNEETNGNGNTSDQEADEGESDL